jgi:hypothetical protein
MIGDGGHWAHGGPTVFTVTFVVEVFTVTQSDRVTVKTSSTIFSIREVRSGP